MSLLDQLRKELSDLQKLLEDESIWKDLLVTYEPPMVERLYTNRGENRLFLHRIHPCGDKSPLLHPHPWPSAVHIVSGLYKMNVAYTYEDSYGVNIQPAVTTYLSAGSSYEMDRQEAWHDVNPIGEPSLSIMLTGPKWKNSHYDTMISIGKLSYPKETQPNLTLEQRDKLFADFRHFFA